MSNTTKRIVAGAFVFAALGTAPVMIAGSAGAASAGGVEQLHQNGAKPAAGPNIYYHAGGVEQLGLKATPDGGVEQL